ncbi:Translation initiation factor 3 subunit J component [Savitreella phatthalungensis]
MSWDDEEFEVDTGAGAPVGVSRGTTSAVGGGGRGRFEDEEQEDVADAWDASSGDEGGAGAVGGAYPAKKKGTLKEALARRQEQEAAAAAARSEAMRNAGPAESASERAERQRAQELAADLNNAADLFGEVHITEEDKTLLKAQTGGGTLSDLLEPTPTTKEAFDDVGLQLAHALKVLGKSRHYPAFVLDLVKALAQPLSAEDTKKIQTALNVAVNAKNTAEKGGPKKQNKKAVAKPVVGNMGNAKSAYTKSLDSSRLDDDYDDFDDFM